MVGVHFGKHGRRTGVFIVIWVEHKVPVVKALVVSIYQAKTMAIGYKADP